MVGMVDSTISKVWLTTQHRLVSVSDTVNELSLSMESQADGDDEREIVQIQRNITIPLTD